MPPELSKIKIWRLRLEHNELTELPPVPIGRDVDLSYNRITHLPDEICKLKKLDLSGNPIPEEEKERLGRVWQQQKQQSQGLKF